MTTPILTWLLIVITLAVLFVIHAVWALRRHRRGTHSAPVHHHFIEIGSENEELYIPGDKVKGETYVYNDPDM